MNLEDKNNLENVGVGNIVNTNKRYTYFRNTKNFGRTKNRHARSFQRYKIMVEEYVWRYKIF